ncbi:hypothetical protein FNV43_RR11814 [Rhamnella rubrinervis]|uniref:Uncharacterized protein n=1 Tax=Rhamnella rubrinervis TaxID=2594499 RepID=A0A8K0H6P0_9ROSA|nr:hypothetical protein FNV43_RR11814 [Rhamnella rubrinervis]
MDSRFDALTDRIPSLSTKIESTEARSRRKYNLRVEQALNGLRVGKSRSLEVLVNGKRGKKAVVMNRKNSIGVEVKMDERASHRNGKKSSRRPLEVPSQMSRGPFGGSRKSTDFVEELSLRGSQAVRTPRRRLQKWPNNFPRSNVVKSRGARTTSFIAFLLFSHIYAKLSPAWSTLEAHPGWLAGPSSASYRGPVHWFGKHSQEAHKAHPRGLEKPSPRLEESISSRSWNPDRHTVEAQPRGAPSPARQALGAQSGAREGQSTVSRSPAQLISKPSSAGEAKRGGEAQPGNWESPANIYAKPSLPHALSPARGSMAVLRAQSSASHDREAQLFGVRSPARQASEA